MPTFLSTSKPKPSTPSSKSELHERDDGSIEAKEDLLQKSLHYDGATPGS
jgi:hypothetical protein